MPSRPVDRLQVGNGLFSHLHPLMKLSKRCPGGLSYLCVYVSAWVCEKISLYHIPYFSMKLLASLFIPDINTQISKTIYITVVLMHIMSVVLITYRFVILCIVVSMPEILVVAIWPITFKIKFHTLVFIDPLLFFVVFICIWHFTILTSTACYNYSDVQTRVENYHHHIKMYSVPKRQHPSISNEAV